MLAKFSLILAASTLCLLSVGAQQTDPREVRTLDQCITIANHDSAQAAANYKLAYDKYTTMIARYNTLSAKYADLQDENADLRDELSHERQLVKDREFDQPAPMGPLDIAPHCVTQTIFQFSYTDCL